MRTTYLLAVVSPFLFVAAACSGDSSGGTGGGGGAGGSGGAGGGTGGGGGVAGSTCGLVAGPGVEMEPNDTRDVPNAYTLGSPVLGCVGSSADKDQFEFAAPADAGGGYVVVTAADIGDALPHIKVFAASDNGEVESAYVTTRGQSVSLHFGAAGGQRYRIEVGNFTAFSDPWKYKLTATYTKVADAFEPNDTRDAAKPITVGTPVNAFMFAGHTKGGAVTKEAYDDFYQVTLASGTVTIAFEGAPTTVNGIIALYDATGKEVDNQYTTSKGASITLMAVPVAAGVFTIRAGIFSPVPEASGDGDVVPDHFTRAYKLTVTQ